jgi:transcriptional regulator with PAS, ATPase and Fis domain
MKSILFAWLGKTDVNCLVNSQSRDLGPIAQAIDQSGFSQLVLLSDFKQKTVDEYTKELKSRYDVKVEFFPQKLKSPTNYEEIYFADLSTIEKIRSRFPDHEFIYHLSPGTPAMTAVWILLAHSIHPAKLIESSPEAGVKDVVIPFDIEATFSPKEKTEFETSVVELSNAKAPEDSQFSGIIHQCESMKQVINQAYRLAMFDIPVLILGESGTGKELFARAIHASSERKDRKMLSINCGAIPKDLLESELFGYVKGAFTGAQKDKKGLIEAADKSTLFLDEVGDLPLSAQVKLLRVLQEGILIPIGSVEEKKVDIRVITATNKDLFTEIEQGSFREDFYYRIAGGTITLAPLRDRKEDIPLLIDHFEELINIRFGKHEGWIYKTISKDTKKLMLQHPWKGNIRELQHRITQLLIWSDHSSVPPEVFQSTATTNIKRTESILNRSFDEHFNINALLAEVSRHYLEKSLEVSGGNKSKASKLLGLPNYQTFTNWCKKFDLD